MFENLTDKLEQTFKRLRGHGRITEANVVESLREVRLALLEADVNFKVVKSFIDSVQAQSMGQDVLQSLTPDQQLIKIVKEELVKILGGEAAGLDLKGRQPVVLMLVGLQGSGKTTTAVKLALHLKKQQKRTPYLVSADGTGPRPGNNCARCATSTGCRCTTPATARRRWRSAAAPSTRRTKGSATC